MRMSSQAIPCFMATSIWSRLEVSKGLGDYQFGAASAMIAAACETRSPASRRWPAPACELIRQCEPQSNDVAPLRTSIVSGGSPSR